MSDEVTSRSGGLHTGETAEADLGAWIVTAIEEAWHDRTCPEGPECRDRALHAAGTVAGQLCADAAMSVVEPMVRGLQKAVADPDTEWVDASIVRLLLDDLGAGEQVQQ